jgi:hypothetical protein
MAPGPSTNECGPFCRWNRTVADRIEGRVFVAARGTVPNPLGSGRSAIEGSVWHGHGVPRRRQQDWSAPVLVVSAEQFVALQKSSIRACPLTNDSVGRSF